MGESSTLRWTVPPAAEHLVAAGGPFELVDEGHVRVFAERPRDLPSVLAAAPPDRTYLVGPGASWTYAEVRQRAGAVAAHLAGAHGIGPGDRVAIAAANSPEHAVAIWATLSLGATVVGLNGWWTSAELAYGLELTSPAVVLADEARLERLGAGLDLHRTVHGAPDAAPPQVEIGERDAAVVLFTSGTTGRPKGAVLSHRNFLHNAQANVLGMSIGASLAGLGLADLPALCMMAGGPFFHISGLLVLLLAPWTGATYVIPRPGRWDAAAHLALTEAHRVTGWSGVPTQLWRLLEHPALEATDLSSLRSINLGGASVPPELVRLLAERMPGVTIGTGYGATETTGMGLQINGPAYLARPDVVGGAQPTVEARIADPDGAPVPDGEVGEICVRHASTFAGYLGDEEATEAAFHDGGWYRTGDFGRVVDGLVQLESRMRDLIIRGGENVYPVEVEHRLVAHPDVVDAAVVGVDHPRLGQEVAAFVVVRDGAAATDDDLRAWVAAALAPFKVPAHVERLAGLPTTETGKVQKHLLRLGG